MSLADSHLSCTSFRDIIVLRLWSDFASFLHRVFQERDVIFLGPTTVNILFMCAWRVQFSRQ